MILCCVVLLLSVIVVKTEYNASLSGDDISDIDVRYSLWPKYYVYGEGTHPTKSKQDSRTGKFEVLPMNVETRYTHLKWVSIGFGGLSLLAIAYYLMIYRKKRNINQAKNLHGSIDEKQFRYCLLKSKDKRADLSIMPLRMESDEDED